jgi:hypothetical protein
MSSAVVLIGGASAGPVWPCCRLGAITEIKKQNPANNIACDFMGIFLQAALMPATSASIKADLVRQR